jgi:hypothetical protein
MRNGLAVSLAVSTIPPPLFGANDQRNDENEGKEGREKGEEKDVLANR